SLFPSFSFFYSSADTRVLHSFPTRRSSDLVLTVALSAKPSDEARVQIERLAAQLGACVDAIVGRDEWQQRRVAIAEALLEPDFRSEEHTSELQSPYDLVCRLLLEKKKKQKE